MNIQEEKTKKMSNTDPIIQNAVNTGAREGQTDPASYKTYVVLLIYTVHSSKSRLERDRGKKKYT